MSDRTEKLTSNLRVLLGALVFVIFGVFATSNRIALSPKELIFMSQIFIFILTICFISFRTYYYKERNDYNEFISKFIAFMILLLPTALIFLSTGIYQYISFLISFLIMLLLCVEHQAKKTNDKNINMIALFLLTIWSQLSALILLVKLSMLPIGLIKSLEFLNLNAVGTIRIVIGILLVAIILISAISTALKTEPILKPLSIKPLTTPQPNNKANDVVKLFYIFIQSFITMLVNPVFISLFCNLLVLGVIRIAIDFLLKVSWHTVINVPE